MAKHVHSKDPRKPAIVAALKKASGGTKVTMLTEIGPDVFEGDCLTKEPGKRLWKHLGVFRVTVPQ